MNRVVTGSSSGGAGSRWEPLPKAEAPTEPGGETGGLTACGQDGRSLRKFLSSRTSLLRADNIRPYGDKTLFCPERRTAFPTRRLWGKPPCGYNKTHIACRAGFPEPAVNRIFSLGRRGDNLSPATGMSARTYNRVRASPVLNFSLLITDS